MKVIRDAQGKVINIGDWDYVYAMEFGENGDEVMVATNPMPAGAVESDEEVIVAEDGGRYTIDDPRVQQESP